MPRDTTYRYEGIECKGNAWDRCISALEGNRECARKIDTFGLGLITGLGREGVFQESARPGSRGSSSWWKVQVHYPSCRTA